MKEYIVTVLARDRVGIVRDVASALAGIGGNITHVSQTVVRGYFTLILSVEMPDERTQLEIRQAVERRGAVGELEVNVMPFTAEPTCETGEAERFTLSMRGRDAPGLIARATGYLADNRINIEDVYAYVHGGEALILAQVAIPNSLDTEQVQAGLQEALEGFDVAAHLQHENIFRATNEIDPVLAL